MAVAVAVAVVVAARHTRKLAAALAGTFEPLRSVPYDRSAAVDMDGSGGGGNPLQARKLFTSTQ